MLVAYMRRYASSDKSVALAAARQWGRFCSAIAQLDLPEQEDLDEPGDEDRIL